VRPRAVPWLKLPPAVEDRLPRPLARPEACERVAIFVTYGARSPHTERFVEWLKGRDYFPPRTRDRPMAPGAAASGDPQLTIVDPWTQPRREVRA